MTLKAFKNCIDKIFVDLISDEGEYNANLKLVKFYYGDKELELKDIQVASKYIVDMCNEVKSEPTSIIINIT